MDKISIETARFNMIEQQIRPAEVLDPKVLDVIANTPREFFVPEKYRALAFSDTEIPLPEHQHMMKPILEGRLLQALNIKPSDRILEIGTGSGYLTALLAKLGQQVTSLEIFESLKNSAEEKLNSQNIANVSLIFSDGSQGWAEGAPYDAIAVTGSIPVEGGAAVFEQQLAVGGRLFIVEGHKPTMSATLVTRLSDDEYQREVLFETVLTPLENTEAPQAFEF